MPVRKVKGGWKWGNSGKVYKTKEEAERQTRVSPWNCMVFLPSIDLA